MSAELDTVLSTETFPPGFAWGVSIGANQSEGNNIASDWWYRETQPNSPVVPSGVACAPP
jgi:beta-glucosidase